MSLHGSLAQCTICLSATFDEEVSINGCAHHYCYLCIETWSRTVNTCPQCKAEFTEIRRLQKPAEGSLRSLSRKRKESSDMVITVKRRKQRADYDEEELRRLGFINDDDDDNDEDNDDNDENENDDNDNGIRGYSSRDGFIIADDIIEYEDDEEEEEPILSDTESEDDEEDDDDSTTDDDDDDDDLVVTRATSNGVSVAVTVPTRSRTTNVRRSGRIALYAN